MSDTKYFIFQYSKFSSILSEIVKLPLHIYYCTINVSKDNNVSLDFTKPDFLTSINKASVYGYSRDSGYQKLTYNDIIKFLSDKKLKLNWKDDLKLRFNLWRNDWFSYIDKNNSYNPTSFPSSDNNIFL